MGKLHMYKSYYENTQPHVGEKKQLHCINTDSFVLNVNGKDIFEDLKKVIIYSSLAN